jgi:Uma2 family endonuclease
VYHEEPEEQVFVTPPLLVVEILSPEDRMSRMQEKMEDYYGMSCRNVWILDPKRNKAYQYDGHAIVEVHSALTTDHPGLTLRVSQLFNK